MPRPPRDTGAGIFHVYTHCVWAAPALFRDDVDRIDFLRGLARVCAQSGFTCISFCLMTTHYHLIVAVEDDVLPIAMRSLNLSYAIGFNLRYELRGHVQFARYGARRIVDEADLVGTYAYVARNPKKAGVSEMPETWKWSSHAGTVGLAEQHSFVDDSTILACFNGVEDRLAALREHVAKS
jgi:putative transposase